MSGTYTFLSGFAEHAHLRERLYPLVEEVFGIPPAMLASLHANGFWNSTYRPYSFFANERAIANVAFFTMPLWINGEMSMAAGIQSVMTHPAHRGAGLMKQLFSTMLQEIDERFETALLFTSTPELYQPYGFQVLPQHSFLLPAVEVPKQGRLRKMNLEQEKDRALLKACFAGQTPASQRFAPVDYASSFYLNMQDPTWQDRLYYADDLDTMIVWQMDGTTLMLYDVIGVELPTLEQICGLIPHPISQVMVWFSPDRLESGGTIAQPIPQVSAGQLMVRGTCNWQQHLFHFPKTAAF